MPREIRLEIVLSTSMDLLVQSLATQTRSTADVAAWRVIDRHQQQQQQQLQVVNPPGDRHADSGRDETRCLECASVTFAALFEWIDALRDAIRQTQVADDPANPRESESQSKSSCPKVMLVVGVALPSCSVEESALVLAVARERHWVYVPVDTSAPLDQQTAVLRDARVDALVTTPDTAIARFLTANARELLEDLPRAVASSVEGFRPAMVFRLSSVTVANKPTIGWMMTGGHERELGESDGDRVHSEQYQIHREGGAAPLYVLFTSGSSGRPKGVVGTRAGAMNRLEWMWTQFPFESQVTRQERVARVTKLTFVDSVSEILGALLKQVPLVHLEANDPTARRSNVILDQSELFVQAVQQLKVSRFTVVPSVLEVLLLQYRSSARLQQALASVRFVLVSGEVLPLSLVVQAASVLPRAKLLNMYGACVRHSGVIDSERGGERSSSLLVFCRFSFAVHSEHLDALTACRKHRGERRCDVDGDPSVAFGSPVDSLDGTWGSDRERSQPNR